MAPVEPTSQLYLAGLSDREQCIDAIRRLVDAVYLKDKALLQTVYTENAVQKLVGYEPTPKETKGREALVQEILGSEHAKNRTASSINNERVAVQPDGKSAYMTFYGDNLFLEDGAATDYAANATKYFTVFARYEAEMVKEADGFWRIAHFTSHCGYLQGDRNILFKNAK